MGDSLEELLPLSRLHVSHQEEAPTWASLEDIDWGERGARRGLGAVEEALIVMRLGRRLASPAVVATIGAAQISRRGRGMAGKASGGGVSGRGSHHHGGGARNGDGAGAGC